MGEMSKQLQLSTSLIVSSYNDQIKGIYLQTNSKDVTVIIQNMYRNYTGGDTFLALPSVALCSTNQYMYYGISTSQYYRGYDSVVLVVGTENNTMIELRPTQNVSVRINSSVDNMTSSIPYSFKINKLQVVYIGSSKDLTGTRIITDKPVSVISGHECGYVLSSECEHLIEQIPPTMYWGRTYYIAPLQRRSGYTIRVLAAYNSTNVVLYCNGAGSSYTIEAGKSFTISHGAYIVQYTLTRKS